jgi:hypothetical protein
MYWKKNCPSANLSTINPISSDLGSNPGLRGGKLAANGLSYGTAILEQPPVAQLGKNLCSLLIHKTEISCRVKNCHWSLS